MMRCRSRWRVALTAFLVCGARQEACPTKIIEDYVPLSTLVSRSSLIVVARNVPPFMLFESVDVGKEIRPYRRPIYPFRWLKVLHGKTPASGVLRVRQANSNILQSLYVFSVKHEPTPWPIVSAYKPAVAWDVNQEKETDLILFLNENEGDWEFTMTNAFESTSKEDEVRAVLSVGPVIQRALQAIYQDLWAIRDRFAPLGQLYPGVVREYQLEYENGKKSRREGPGPLGKEAPLRYSPDYCRLSVSVDYPSDFKPIARMMQAGVPRLYGEVQNLPLAVWVEAKADDALASAVGTIIDKRLDEMRNSLAGYKPLNMMRDGSAEQDSR